MVIYSKADSTKENMGLTTWKNSPDGRILKSDVTIAKNYLSGKEIRQLERTVSGYFDYIEDLIERENTFTMTEFADSVNEFLSFRRYQILKDHGKISRQQALEKAGKDSVLKDKLLATRKSPNPIADFCDIANEYGIQISVMDIVNQGEEFYAEIKRSTNGGGENSPDLDFQNDEYSIFMMRLQ